MRPNSDLTMMNLRRYYYFWFTSVILTSATWLTASQQTRPNILFVMSDDHAAHAISAYGSRVNNTPHLDRLAREGMRFDRCFAVNSICTPSRATIITGKYSHINGVPAFNRFDGSQPTVAKYLQSSGYHTAVIGKWHLGSNPTGFDEWCILPDQGDYVNPTFIDRGGRHVVNGYVTDIITDKGIECLKRRPVDKPFFLMLHHKAPHRNWQPNEKYRVRFASQPIPIPEPRTLRDDYATRTDAIRECEQKVFSDLTRDDLKLISPANPSGSERAAWLDVKPTEVEIVADDRTNRLAGESLNAWKYQRFMQDYLACVQSVDDSVGRLLDWLEQSGVGSNTVVIYTSDQGFFLGEHGLYDKRFMYEESIRMPLLFRWPGVIKPGSVQSALAINADFAPTFMNLVGLTVPADVQGTSLLPLLAGNRPTDWRRSIYYRYYDDPGHHITRAHYGVRTETHKLIYFWKKDQWELYDLVKDPGEMLNLYEDPAQRSIVTELKSELRRLKTELKDEDQFSSGIPTRTNGLSSTERQVIPQSK